MQQHVKEVHYGMKRYDIGDTPDGKHEDVKHNRKHRDVKDNGKHNEKWVIKL